MNLFKFSICEVQFFIFLPLRGENIGLVGLSLMYHVCAINFLFFLSQLVASCVESQFHRLKTFSTTTEATRGEDGNWTRLETGGEEVNETDTPFFPDFDDIDFEEDQTTTERKKVTIRWSSSKEEIPEVILILTFSYLVFVKLYFTLSFHVSEQMLNKNKISIRLFLCFI